MRKRGRGYYYSLGAKKVGKWFTRFRDVVLFLFESEARDGRLSGTEKNDALDITPINQFHVISGRLNQLHVIYSNVQCRLEVAVLEKERIALNNPATERVEELPQLTRITLS